MYVPHTHIHDVSKSEKKADFSFTSLTVVPSRSEAIDFTTTVGFMYGRLYMSKSKPTINLFYKW